MYPPCEESLSFAYLIKADSRKAKKALIDVEALLALPGNVYGKLNEV